MRRRSSILAGLASGGIAVTVALLMVAGSQAAYAAEAKVGLGTAGSFAVLAGSTVTNTGPTVVSGDLGVSPGTAITGFPPGQVINGTQHAADAVALQAQNDLTTAYDDAAGRSPATSVSSDLGGQTLVGGVYRSAAAMALTGTVTLDGQGDPNTVFIFQAGSTLTTATNSRVALVNGTQACNVFWKVGSSATLGTDTVFNGTVMALTTITLQTNTTVIGRLLARNGAVNLDANTITRPGCLSGPTGGPTATATTDGPTATATTGGPSATGAPTTTPTTGSPTATGTATASSVPAPAGPAGPADPASSTGAPGGPPAASSPPGYSVPVGNPDTGREGDGLFGTTSSFGPIWLAFGLAALGASGLAGAHAWRRSRATDPPG